MLVLAFFVIFSFKKSQITLSERWPAINLKDFESMYKDRTYIIQEGTKTNTQFDNKYKGDTVSVLYKYA